MRSRALAALVMALGCAPPRGDALVICHNANCAANAAQGGDDTIPALDRSLALRTAQARVVFDGIELDSVWHRRTGRCIFSHAPRPDADAAQRSASHQRDDGGIAIWARSPSAEELYTILAYGLRYLVVNDVEEARGLLDSSR